MTMLAYCRSSSASQDTGLQLQVDRMRGLGIEPDHIFSELKSGKNADRPELKNLLRFARKGDVVVITKLDRLGRSLSDLLTITKGLEERGVNLRVLDQHIDTSTPGGRLFFHMVSAFSEFERSLINDRAREGREKHLALLRSKGLKPGRPSKVGEKMMERIKALRGEGWVVRAIGEELGLSRSTVNRALANEA